MRNFAPWLVVIAMVIASAAVRAAAAAPAGQALPPEVQRAWAGTGLPISSLGVYVRQVDEPRPTLALNAEAPYVLASTAKIVTSLAALGLLGPHWRWRTHAFTTGPIVSGRLLGDLMIVGGGNAQLSSADLRGWMQRMRGQGLDEVLGDILIDRSAFTLSDDDHRHTPLPAPDRPHHARPDALALDAGIAAQTMAKLWAEAGVRLRGRVRHVDLTAGDPEHSRLPLIGADGEPVLPWSTHLSPALPEILREINKTSNNLAARHLMLALAPGFPVRTATLAHAQQSVQGWLRRQGLAADDMAIENGSGLSRAERGKPRALVQLLCNAWASSQARSFVDSLPVAGVDGTLQHRLQGGAAQGQAFLKTGSLRDARALAGYVRSKSGKVYAVAALVNHPQAALGTVALDALIEWLARNG